MTNPSTPNDLRPPTEADRAREREAIDALHAARNIQRPDAPTEPDPFTMTPATGPNEDGLTHQARLAHAATDDERAAIAQELEARLESPPVAPNAPKE